MPDLEIENRLSQPEICTGHPEYIARLIKIFKNQP
jgi:hypothetical protein